MATIPEFLDGHVTLEVECLDRLYLNGYVGKLATGGGLIGFLCGQLGKPVPSPVVLGPSQRDSARLGKVLGGARCHTSLPVQSQGTERTTSLDEFRRQRASPRRHVVSIGVAQEKAEAFNVKLVNGQFQFDRDKTVYVNHYYFYIDDVDFGPLFIQSVQLCAVERRNSPQRSRMGQTATGEKRRSPTKPLITDFSPAPIRRAAAHLRLAGAGRY